jgi:hypothetical protein
VLLPEWEDTMALRARNSAVEIKLEVTEGVDPLGWTDPSSDMIPTSSVSESLNFDQQTLQEFGGGLDAGETVSGAAKPVLTLRGALRGSGTPGTPIPAFSALMKSAAFTETAYAATLPSASTVTASAGTANTITFDGGGSPGSQFPATTALGAVLIGRVVELAGNPSTATTATIIAYTASGSDRTVTFNRSATDCGCTGAVFTVATTMKVLAGTLWHSDSPTPHPSVFGRQFRDGIMQAFSGCRSNYRQTVRAGTFAEFEFALGGQLVGRSDVAVPAAPTAGFLSPNVGVNSYCTFTGGALAGAKLEMQELSFDCGNQGQYPDDINQLSGVQPYLIGSRKITGSINPLLTLAATRNALALIQAGTKGSLCVAIGPKTAYSAATGNRFSFLFPNAKFLDGSISEDNVVLREALSFEATSFNNGLRIYHF